PENLGEHSFDQVMTNNRPFGDGSSLRSKANVPVALDRHESILRQAFQGKGYGRPGHREPMSKGRRDYRLTLSFGFCDGLEIVLFGNSDHVRIFMFQPGRVHRFWARWTS